MERRSDFSVDRILSVPLEPRGPQEAQRAPDGHRGVACAGFAPESRYLHNFMPPVPVPVPVPVFIHRCPQFPVAAFGSDFYACGCGFYGFYSNCGTSTTSSHSAGAPPAGLSAHQPPRAAAWPSPKGQRSRTTFTDSQTKQLEALLQRTRYPTKEARTELARSTGLSEDTVRVWFKNRRARGVRR